MLLHRYNSGGSGALRRAARVCALRQRTPMLDVCSHIEDHTVDFWDYHREHTVGPVVERFDIEPFSDFSAK